MSELEVREFQVRLEESADSEKREFVGVAVPWAQVANIAGLYEERVERGAVQESDDAKIWWRHDEPVGKVLSHRDTDEGWEITGVLSKTVRGDEAYTLLRDGVVDRLSIGFEPVEHRDETNEDGSVVRTRTKIRVREVSIVPLPAYGGAAVTQVREATNKEETMSVETLTKADLTEVRESVEDLERRVANFQVSSPEPKGDQFRSIGHLVKQLASGDEAAVRAYNASFETRDYDGATSADTILNDSWIGSIVEIIKRRRPVTSTFASGTLPAQGMTVEYAVLEADSTKVEEQENEGDALAFGKVKIGNRNAEVKTFGGWTSLSRQAIERSHEGILNTTFEALVEKYGQATEAYFRSVLNAALTATGGPNTQNPALATITADLTDQDGVVGAVLDLAEHFDTEGRSLDGVFVSKDVFKALYAVPANDRILQVSGAPVDKVGSITVQTAQGSVAGLEFKLLPNAAAGTTLAYDKTALKYLEAPGAPWRLQDENIVTLTKDFSLYGYLSAFVQKRNGLVKVVAGD